MFAMNNEVSNIPVLTPGTCVIIWVEATLSKLIFYRLQSTLSKTDTFGTGPDCRGNMTPLSLTLNLLG